jgi:uncharacterized protein YyaL (SSP411 family)
VDAGWVVPHFEKMLYDNALLARVYLHWWRLTGSTVGRRIAEETCDFMVGRLGTTQGGLASSLDADTSVDGHAVEGATYVWTPAQLVDVLGPDHGAWVAALTGVTEAGTFEHGSSTLQLTRDVWAAPEPAPSGEGVASEAAVRTQSGEGAGAGAVAVAAAPSGEGVASEAATRTQSGEGAGAGAGQADDAQRWQEARARLREARGTRPQPTRDDKVVAAWNGLAIAALAECGGLLDRPDLLDAARNAADLLLELHVVDGVLRRVSRDGAVGAPEGVLEDYADVVEGLLALHAATGEARWVEAVGPLVSSLLELFWREMDDGTAGFTDVPHASPDPVLHTASGGRVSAADPTDNAYPSGVFAAAGVLLSWAALTGDARCREVAEAALASARQIGGAAPRFAGWGLAVAEAALDGPREVAVVGVPDDDRAHALRLEALRGTAPGLVLAAGAPGEHPVVPLLEGRGLRDGSAAAYPCRGFVCDLPVTQPDQLRAFTRPR